MLISSTFCHAFRFAKANTRKKPQISPIKTEVYQLKKLKIYIKCSYVCVCVKMVNVHTLTPALTHSWTASLTPGRQGSYIVDYSSHTVIFMWKTDARYFHYGDGTERKKKRRKEKRLSCNCKKYASDIKIIDVREKLH